MDFLTRNKSKMIDTVILLSETIYRIEKGLHFMIYFQLRSEPLSFYRNALFLPTWLKYHNSTSNCTVQLCIFSRFFFCIVLHILLKIIPLFLSLFLLLAPHVVHYGKFCLVFSAAMKNGIYLLH